MRFISLLMIFGFIVAGSTSVEAATSRKAKKSVTAKASNKKAKAAPAIAKNRTRGELKTDVRFDDAVLHGQYQMPEEGLAKVENEKVLSDILGVRKHFKDRLAEASQQE